MAESDFSATPVKRCKTCGETKPATTKYFYKDKTCRYGVAPTCKTCTAAYQADRYNQHKEEIRRHDQEWTRLNPDKKAAHKEKRKQRLRSDPYFGMPFFKSKQIVAQGGLCYYCQSPLGTKDVHVDHKIPISRGGTNHPDNKVVCCHRCNARKHTKTDVEFLEMLRREKDGRST